MSDPKYTTMMALHQALHQQPVEFEQSVHGLLAGRIQNAIEKKREEIGNAVFGNPNTEVNPNDGETSEGDNTETGELESEVKSTEEAPVEETPAEESKEEDTPTEE